MIGKFLLNPLNRIALSLLATGIVLMSVGMTNDGEKPSCVLAYLAGFMLGCSFGVSSIVRYIKDVSRAN